MLKTLAFLQGKKWTTLMVSRAYFGNWLRDYSQAVDVGSLKGVNAATIRILVSAQRPNGPIPARQRPKRMP
jgi:hypothetical protein